MVVLTIFQAGCTKQEEMPTEKGYLKGKISIGPLCPVEHNPPDPGCLPTAETYKAWPIDIFNAGGEVKIARIQPELNGNYISELFAGEYLVDLENPQSGPGSSNLPVTVYISANDTTILDVNIDTGIR